LLLSGRNLLPIAIAVSAMFAQKPLPDPKTLIATALDNQNTFASKRLNYVCKYTNHLLYPPKRWREYEVFFINGYEIRRLLSENGRMLSQGQAAEEASLDRVIEEVKKRAPATSLPMDGGWAFGHTPHTFSQTVEGAIMRLSTFEGESRVTYNGRPAIKMTYRGNRKIQPQTDEERAAQVFEGSIIIDENDQAVVRIGGTAEGDAWHGSQHLVFHSHILGFDEVRVDDGLYLPLAWTVAPPFPASYSETQDFWLEGCRKYRVSSHIVP
jgi:hypothetical protein